MANIIECKNVSFSFVSEDNVETKVLDDISLSVAEGEFVTEAESLLWQSI